MFKKFGEYSKKNPERLPKENWIKQLLKWVYGRFRIGALCEISQIILRRSVKGFFWRISSKIL